MAQNDAGSSAGALVLRLVGLTKARVMYKMTGLVPTESGAAPYTYRDTMSEDIEFLGYDIQLANFGGRVAPGEHNYSFSVTLPPELPPSMQEVGGNGSCAIAYGFVAQLRRPGLLNFNAEAKAQLKVLSRPQETDATLPVVAGPEVTAVTQCCCLKRGSMSLGIQADRSAVGLNETLGVTVVARNDSSAAAKKLHIEVMQETTWYARGYKESSKRAVKSIVVSGAERRAIDAGVQRRQSAAATTDTARVDLEEQLAAGAGTRYEISIPGDTSISFQSEMIEVKHMLTVRLQAPFYANGPDVSTPLRIQPGTTGVLPAANAKEKHLAPSSAAAAPSSTARPVSVPQSAVKLAYS